MKFARFNGGRTALIVGLGCGTVLDVASSLAALGKADQERIAQVLPGDGSGSWSTMIGRWAEVRASFQRLAELGDAGQNGLTLHALKDVTLEAPIPCRERRIFALGANTVEHMQGVFAARAPDMKLSVEDVYRPKNAGASPIGFHVFPDSIIGPDAALTPPASVKKLDYEGECAAILASAGRDQGLDAVVWGYTAWNDFGMRDGHLGMIAINPPMAYSLNLWKNFDGANACGPWVVVDEGRNIDALRCELFVNGERRQDWNTSDMVYSFADMFDHASRFMTLKPGDIVVSGTGAGTALEGAIDSDLWLKAGDLVEVRLDGVAPLITTIA